VIENFRQIQVSTGIDVTAKNISVEEELHHTQHALEDANIRAVSAEARLANLEKEMAEWGMRQKERRPVRVYMDGCFDMMHFG
jgi:hypothetical protein